MGLFSNLFRRKNSIDHSSNLAKTSQMLEEDVFWKIVQESLEQTKNQDEQLQFLIERLEKLTEAEIIGFELRTEDLLYNIYNSNMWCAGCIMNGKDSYDSFECFRSWVISRGKKAYDDAKNNPDSLITQVNNKSESYEFQAFYDVAGIAFLEKTGKQLYDFIDRDNLNATSHRFKTDEIHDTQFDSAWDIKNPDSMKAICPRLFQKMWKVTM